MSKLKKCELCEENNAQVKHHPVPRNIIKQINPSSQLKNLTIDLCKRCELKCHFGFLEFLIHNQLHDGYNRLNAIKYMILREYLIFHNPQVWKKYKNHMDKFIQNSMEEFKKEIKCI